MRIFTINLADCANEKTLRSDYKFHYGMSDNGWNLFDTPTIGNVRLSEILREDYNLCPYDEGEEYRGIPTGQAYLDEDGDIIDYQYVTLDNHPERLKYSVTSDNILISSLRQAKSPALCFNEPNIKEYVFSNGFYIFKALDNWEPRFILYVLRSQKITNFINNVIYRGIGISSYNVSDLLNVQIRNVPVSEQRQALAHIKPFEDEIRKLKANRVSTKSIIDDVLTSEFGIDAHSLHEIASETIASTDFYHIALNNSSLRFSNRWNKASRIQDCLRQMSEHFRQLSKHISKTQNGYSPECSDDASELQVLALDSLDYCGKLLTDRVKFSDTGRRDIEKFLLSDGDFLISRGNGSDGLISLASIASINEDSPRTIFPDIMIRVTFHETVDVLYMAYVFNSFIGRLYFPFAAKGSNIKKTSKKELYDFYVPLPRLEEQKRIALEIQSAIDAQSHTEMQISQLREKIDTIIEYTLKAT